MTEDTARMRPPGEPVTPEPDPEPVPGPVGRVNLRAPRPVAAPSVAAAPPPTGWTVRNIIIGVIALVITVGGLLLILQGAFQLTPA